MSRYSIPGLGKSGMVRTSAFSSSALATHLSPRSVLALLACSRFAMLLGIERALGRDLALRLGPDVLVAEIAEDGREQQEDHHHDPGAMAIFQLGLGGPHQEGRHVLGHLVDRRRGRSLGIGDLPVARQRRRHRQVQIGEIRIVIEAVGGLGGREILEQFRRLRLITGEQRIDVSRPALARLGHQRQVGRKRIALAARAAVSLGYGDGKRSAGVALRVAGSPVSGLIVGTSIFQKLPDPAYALICPSL